MNFFNDLDWGAYYHFHNQTEWYQPLFVAATWATRLPVTAPVFALGCWYLLSRKQVKPTVMLALGFALALILGEGLKLVFAREGPNFPVLGAPWGYSFPCTQSLISVVVYVGLLAVIGQQISRGFAVVFALAGLALTAFLNFCIIATLHSFVSDVMAGWVGGQVLLVFLYLWSQPPSPRPNPDIST